MPQTVTIDQKTARELVSSIRELTREVASLKRARLSAAKQIASKRPKYGSAEWWDEETRKGEEDIKAGRYTVVSTEKELDKFFEELHKSAQK